jgi:hypothetical protein
MQKLWLRVKIRLNRSLFAYFFMVSFIILSSIGAALIYPPAGLRVGGATCGFFGFLLGRE